MTADVSGRRHRRNLQAQPNGGGDGQQAAAPTPANFRTRRCHRRSVIDRRGYRNRGGAHQGTVGGATAVKPLRRDGL
jgi:hypothetical protein